MCPADRRYDHQEPNPDGDRPRTRANFGRSRYRATVYVAQKRLSGNRHFQWDSEGERARIGLMLMTLKVLMPECKAIMEAYAKKRNPNDGQGN
jgi:hypothetical protein